MNIVQKIKYRRFFKNISASGNCKSKIIDLLEKENFLKLNKFSDYFSFIAILSDLTFPISVIPYSNDSFLLKDTQSKTANISLQKSCISHIFEEGNVIIENTYNLATKNLICRHLMIDNYHCYVYIYDSYTEFVFEAIPLEEDINTNIADNLKYKITLTLKDLIFEDSYNRNLVPILCEEFFAITVTDLSFFDIIERYSDDFSIRVERDGDVLSAKKDGKYSLLAIFNCKDFSYSFKTKQEDLTTLKSIYSEFLRPFI